MKTNNSLPASLRGENYAIIAQGNHANIYPGELHEVQTLDELKELQTPWKVVTFLTPSRAMQEAGRSAIGNEPILAIVSNTKDVRNMTRAKLRELLETHGKDDFSVGGFNPSISDTAYWEKVVEAQKHIRDGDICQIVLARSFTAPITGVDLMKTPLSILARLLQIKWTSMTALFHTQDHSYAFASPERHLSIKNDRALINPIAGTMKIGDMGTFDDRLENFLMRDQKERSELTMLLDEGTKMIARFCPHGHIEWPFLRETGAVIHTEYLISGKIVSGTHAIDALRQTLNAPTLTGSPINRACEIIARIEALTRGYYGGVFGVYRNSWNLDTSIAIRGVHLDHRNETVTITAGAWITQASLPEKEAEETRMKAEGNIAILTWKAWMRSTVLSPTEKRRYEKRIQQHRNAFLSQFHFWEKSALEPCPELLWKTVQILNFDDDFSYILGVMIESLWARVRVVHYSKYVPGEDILILGGWPGDINDYGDEKMNALRLAMVERGDTPVLGICLGCQAICQHLGIEVKKLEHPQQGVQSDILLGWEIEKVGHYNSFAGFGMKQWYKTVLKPDWNIDMIHDPERKMLGVQFHPESVMTQNGREILRKLLLKLMK